MTELPAGLDVRRRSAVRDWFNHAARDIEACYHLAGQASVAQSFRDPVGTWETNALGTQNIVEALAAAAPTASLLVVSSSEVYGSPDPAELPLREDASLRPRSPYAASKVAAEAAALEGVFGRGLRVVIARPFNHVGPGQSPQFVVPSLVARVLRALETGASVVRVGNLEARRDFCDVRDVVRAYRLLVLNGEAATPYNVCSGRSASVREVLSMVLQAAGERLEVEVDPSLLRPTDVPMIYGDPTRLERTTGFRPERPLSATIEELVTEALRIRRATGRGERS